MTNTPADGQTWRIEARDGFWWVQVPWSGGWDDRFRCYYEADADVILRDHDAAATVARLEAERDRGRSLKSREYIAQLQADLARVTAERDLARQEWRETEAEVRHSAGRNFELLGEIVELKATITALEQRATEAEADEQQTETWEKRPWPRHEIDPYPPRVARGLAYTLSPQV